MRPQPHLELVAELTESWTIRDAVAYIDQSTELARELHEVDRMAERTAKGGRKDGAR